MIAVKTLLFRHSLSIHQQVKVLRISLDDEGKFYRENMLHFRGALVQVCNFSIIKTQH